MDNNESRTEQNTHKTKGYGVVFSLLLGFVLIFVAIPISVWQAGQERGSRKY